MGKYFCIGKISILKEFPFDCVRREIFEELGIKIKVELKGLQLTFYKSKVIPSFFFLGEIDKFRKTQDEDECIEDVKFFSFEECQNMIKKLENLEGKWKNWGLFRENQLRFALSLLTVFSRYSSHISQV